MSTELAPEVSLTPDSAEAALPAKPEHRGPSEIVPNLLIDDFKEKQIRRGVLIPLKTTQEVRQDHTITHAYITRAPTRQANDVITALRNMRPDDNSANPLPHLRRCSKPGDLPAHLKTQFMNDTAVGRQIHTAKSTWIYIIIGEVKDFTQEELTEVLSIIEGDEGELFIEKIPIPLLAPTSQVQAAMWSSQFWPTVYRKNNPLGPHPSIVARGTEDIKDDSSVWMALAHRVALQAKETGIGEAIGAVIVQRDGGKVELVGVAGTLAGTRSAARWGYQQPYDTLRCPCYQHGGSEACSTRETSCWPPF
ncbi:hypothetical protein NXS19_001795 [Fusarium pseudograminearum]|nr:hypothetical protein NXS19_001795 [Fusarium pseudograminearum]